MHINDCKLGTRVVAVGGNPSTVRGRLGTITDRTNSFGGILLATVHFDGYWTLGCNPLILHPTITQEIIDAFATTTNI